MSNVLAFWYAIGVLCTVYGCAFVKARYNKDFAAFLHYSKTLPESYDFDGDEGLHPAGWFDFDEIRKYYLNTYNTDLWEDKFTRREIGKLLNIYRRLGLVERKCHWNHYVYRVR